MSRKVPIADTITPLITLAIRYHPRVFFYLLPFPISIKVNKFNGLVVLKWDSGLLKFIPWYLSTIFFAGWTVGSCAYVVIHYILSYSRVVGKQVDIKLLDVIIAIGGGVFELTQIGTLILFLRFSELFQGFNRFVLLDRHCKIILIVLKIFIEF